MAAPIHRPRIAAILWLASLAYAQSPDRLAVSSNHRFLQHQDGSPFFWLADTGWLLLSKLDRAETIRYLDDRQKKGFNVVQVMLLHSPEMRTAAGAPALTDGDP